MRPRPLGYKTIFMLNRHELQLLNNKDVNYFHQTRSGCMHHAYY